MIRKRIWIGKWRVDFIFAPDGYDKEEVLSRLSRLGASDKDISRIGEVIDNHEKNTGFTFVSPYESTILVAVGPTTSGSEFVNTISHEMYHLAVAIADDLNIDLFGEGPAYLTGDTLQSLVDVICRLGCTKCNHSDTF